MEKDAGPSRLTSPGAAGAGSGGSRLSRRWLGAIAIVLTLLTGGIGACGYVSSRAHRDSQAITGGDAAAVAAAKDCVAATQPADVTALPASQRKLDECSTGDFKTQMTWYDAVLTEAYQATNVHVQMPEIHAAFERTNDDGSTVALVAFRAKISQAGMADRENSYRVRVKMVPENGQFKIAKLDQVAR
jgi:Mce-associated membrane protein